MICPREQLFHFFFEGDQDTIDESNLINFIGQEALNQRQNVEMQKIASSIMKQAAESYYASRRTQTGYHFGAALLKWSIALQNQELFSVAVEGSIRGEGLLTDEMLKQIVDAVICSNSKVMPNWEQWYVQLNHPSVIGSNMATQGSGLSLRKRTLLAIFKTYSTDSRPYFQYLLFHRRRY